MALAALLVAVTACDGDAERVRRPRGSAVWVDPESAPLTAEGQRVLRSAGVEEVFLEVAEIAWTDGGARLDDVPSALNGAVPTGTPVTLVVQGASPPPDTDPQAAAEELAGSLRDLRYRASQASLLPVGIHLGVDASPASETAAELLRALRPALGDDLLLSTSVEPERVGEGEIQSLASAVDYVVAFLYGQAPGTPDEPTAWDPYTAAGWIPALEDLGVDYLVGLHVLGHADHLGPAGERRTTTTHASLRSLADDPTLRLSIDDALHSGVGRLVHTFQAQGASRAAGWRVAPGDRIRVVRTAPALLRDLVERVEATDPRRHTGYLFHRVAAPEEDLSFGPAEVAACLGAVSPVPRLGWKLVVESSQDDFAVIQVELLNRSRQRTDLAATDGNYLEVRVQGGYFERVDPGAFSRYTLWRGDQEARPGTGWREPDGVRLYTRVVGAEERIGGAVLDLRTRGGEPSVSVSGRFFLPDGTELELPREGGPLESSMEGPAERRRAE